MMKSSIWFHNQPEFKNWIDSEAEAIVVGGGLLGLLTAYWLSESGIKPVIIEARKIGSGTSGHTTGKITSQHGMIYDELISKFGKEKAKEYALANESAIKDYKNVIESEKIDCDFAETSARIFSEDKKNTHKLIDEEKAAKSLGIDAEIVKSFLGESLEFKRQAMFHPYDFMIGLAKRLNEKEVSIVEGERVIEYEDKGGHCVLHTDKKIYKSHYIVLATLAPINEKAFYSMQIKPVKHHAIAFESKNDLDAMHLKLENPIISFRQHKKHIIAIGKNVQLGHSDDNAYAELESEARKRMDLGKITNKWSAHDLESMDKMPLIGSISPISKRIFTATGFRAWGITQSMVASKIIVNLIKGEKENIYNPLRLKGSAGKFIKQTKHVAEHLVKKNSKRCTHMGCSLSWNEKENTYDCPCHGSRFDKQGGIITGPATKPLKDDSKK